MKVRAGSQYVYNPVMMDLIDPKAPSLKKGDTCRVINLPGAPKANTMGQCHVETLDGTFLGMVCCNSLTPAPKGTPATK
jgi:hypothetical protein